MASPTKAAVAKKTGAHRGRKPGQKVAPQNPEVKRIRQEVKAAIYQKTLQETLRALVLNEPAEKSAFEDVDYKKVPDGKGGLKETHPITDGIAKVKGFLSSRGIPEEAGFRFVGKLEEWERIKLLTKPKKHLSADEIVAKKAKLLAQLKALESQQSMS